MGNDLTNSIMTALLARGLKPTVEQAETSDDSDVLRFDGSDLYLSVDADGFVSLNERMSVGGNVMMTDWQRAGQEMAVFATPDTLRCWFLSQTVGFPSNLNIGIFS